MPDSEAQLPSRRFSRDFRGVVLARTHLPGLSSLSMLEDIVIHQMDIRRPLERPRHVPDRRMIPVARDLWTNSFFPGAKLFEGMTPHRDRRGLQPSRRWSWMSPGPSRRWFSPWPVASPRSTDCKVMDQRSCLSAQRLSGDGEGLISPKANWPASRRYVLLLGALRMCALCGLPSGTSLAQALSPRCRTGRRGVRIS